MNISNVIGLSVTAALFGLSQTTLHGNPRDLPFGLVFDMDREAVVKHFENDSEFEKSTPVIEYDSLSFQTMQKISGITFDRLDVYFLNGPGVDGIFRVDLSSESTDNGQEALQKLADIKKYFEQQGLEPNIDRFESLESWGDLEDRVVLEYFGEPASIRLTSRVGNTILWAGFFSQISWVDQADIAVLYEKENSPNELLEAYHQILEAEMYFLAEIFCSPSGMEELSDWKKTVDKFPQFIDLLYDLDVAEASVYGATAEVEVLNPVTPFTASLSKEEGLWKIHSALPRLLSQMHSIR